VASPGFKARGWGRGTACMFMKSDRNHRNLYINIINWKTEMKMLVLL